MNVRLRRFLPIAVLAAVSALPSCGSSTSPTPVASPTPVPVANAVVSSGTGLLPARTLAPLPFNTIAAGRLDVTVEWTLVTNDVDVYLAAGACSFAQFTAGQCSIIAYSESTTDKPERLTLSVPAGNYVLLIGNIGPADESVAFQVVLTTGPGTASVSSSSARPGHVRRITPSGRYTGSWASLPIPISTR